MTLRLDLLRHGETELGGGLPREQLLSVAVPHGALLHVQVSAEGELREVSA